MNPKAIHNVN